MNMKYVIISLIALGLTSALAQARPHFRRHHHGGPRVSFGFSVGRPAYAPVVYRPYCYAAPCGYYCAPVAPVIYEVPVERPRFGFSFGTGGTSFGFSV
jgi:hypothetical protein